jgi:peptidoglycan-associated lipoprotein
MAGQSTSGNRIRILLQTLGARIEPSTTVTEGSFMSTMKKLIGVMFAMVLVTGCSSQQGDDADGSGDQSGSNGDNGGASTRGAAGSWDSLASQFGNVVYFEFDRYEILPSSEEILGAYGKLLKSTGENATLEGHADERGTREYNMALGERRGKAVADYLTMQGVGASQLEVVSFGEERPAVASSNESAYSKNRRVEIIKK